MRRQAHYGIEAVGRLGSRGRTTAVTTIRVGHDVPADVEIATQRLGLPLGPAVDRDGGPTGTLVEVRPAAHLRA